jgi:hypothetical protein
MSATLIRTCPLCGLRFDNLPILELHIREDHRGRTRQPAPEDAGREGQRRIGGPGTMAARLAGPRIPADTIIQRPPNG